MSRGRSQAKTFCLTFVLAFSALLSAAAEARFHGLTADLSASFLVPVTWAADSPTLNHLGLDALLGLEYDSPIALQFRLEGGYLRASASSISSSGELYRGWEGLRLAFLGGFAFGPYPLGRVGTLEPSLLAGGALTSADYLDTALAYAYPSLVLEPRAFVRLRSSGSSSAAQGPWLAFPIELMFRAGTYTLAPGVSVGWRTSIEGNR